MSHIQWLTYDLADLCKATKHQVFKELFVNTASKKEQGKKQSYIF